MFMIIIPAHQFSPFVEIDGPEEGLRRYNPRHGEGGNGSCNGVGEKSREGSFFQLKKSHLGCYLGLNKCWIERGHSTMVVGESSTGRGCRRIVERSENEKKMVNKDDLRKCLEIRGME
ncbi:hypothetical protein K1719_021191 [Acacia pycnantha]|nr:hypothetical protein K1719_047518 [Acacia pycnantha]KAI9107855.1 hypothetical protein K1719_021191 [Acacia pycnantha]